MTGRQEGPIFAGMTRLWRDIANATPFLDPACLGRRRSKPKVATDGDECGQQSDQFL